MNGSVEKSDVVIQGCLDSCTRLLVVTNTLTAPQFCARWNEHNSIGPHMRHCYEHFSALRDGFDGGTINYDIRERNQELEQDPAAFAAVMTGIVRWLEAMDAEILEAPLTIRQIPRVGAEEISSASTLRRELLFLTSHTIHHLAIVSMLAEIHGVALPPDLGVAYSTTTHEQHLDDGSATVASAPH